MGCPPGLDVLGPVLEVGEALPQRFEVGIAATGALGRFPRERHDAGDDAEHDQEPEIRVPSFDRNADLDDRDTSQYHQHAEAKQPGPGAAAGADQQAEPRQLLAQPRAGREKARVFEDGRGLGLGGEGAQDLAFERPVDLGLHARYRSQLLAVGAQEFPVEQRDDRDPPGFGFLAAQVGDEVGIQSVQADAVGMRDPLVGRLGEQPGQRAPEQLNHHRQDDVEEQKRRAGQIEGIHGQPQTSFRARSCMAAARSTRCSRVAGATPWSRS